MLKVTLVEAGHKIKQNPKLFIALFLNMVVLLSMLYIYVQIAAKSTSYFVSATLLYLVIYSLYNYMFEKLQKRLQQPKGHRAPAEPFDFAKYQQQYRNNQ